MTSNEPSWLLKAKLCLGQKEVPGPQSNLWIEKLWLARPGGRWFWEHFGRDDSKLPWCGAFAAHCFDSVGLPFPQHYQRAAAWGSWGVALDRPAYGCVIVFARAGGGHVGFVVGESEKGNLLVLGGNQNDSVRVSEFKRDAVRAFRWPAGVPFPGYTKLPRGAAQLSTSEA